MKKGDKLLYGILTVAVLGFLISGYLSYHHFAVRAGAEGWCNIGDAANCDKVALSRFSELFGVPVAVFGMLYFVVLGLLASNQLKKRDDEIIFLLDWSCLGLIFITYFIYGEYVVGSLCILCTVVHLLVIFAAVCSYKVLDKPMKKYVRKYLSWNFFKTRASRLYILALISALILILIFSQL